MVSRRRAARTTANAGPSIAVLPFVNLSGDPSNEYFSDGITEEILNALAQLPGLAVAARTSAFQFKGREADLREVGRRLGVTTILEGSVQRDDGRVRITAQLIDAGDGFHRWSGRFDRNLTDIFAGEDEIARTIADTLRVSLGLAPHGRLVRNTTADPMVYDRYLQAHALIVQRGAALHTATTVPDSALARDATFAPAWAELATAYELLPSWYLSPPDVALPAAERAARHALALDGTLGRGYAALAAVWRDRGAWDRADSAFRRALELAPGDPETISQYAQFTGVMGDPARTVEWSERAQRLDPLAPIPAASLGVALGFQHRYDSAAVVLRHAIALGPTLPLAYFFLMWNEVYAGRYDAAEQAARRGAALAGADPETYARVIRGVADPAGRPAARALLDAQPMSASWELAPSARVRWYALLADTAVVLRLLDSAGPKDPFSFGVWIMSPAFDRLRQTPSFATALQRLGLPYHRARP
jgi:adenylate cyclase